jgi:predicted SPOUT superfamily RNA methylase MTH1
MSNKHRNELRQRNSLSKRRTSIAIPASIVSDTPHLREKTTKIGLIGRAAAIFKVNEIIIYLDNPRTSQMAQMDSIATLLTYMDTPQYLRKRLFKIKPELQYAGILPPLRTPHHPLNHRMTALKLGEYREGATVSTTREGTLIDIGVEQPALLMNVQKPADKRVTVRVTKIGKRVEVDLVDRAEVPEHWGYSVNVETQPFGKLVKNRNFDLAVATSKLGVPFKDVLEELAQKWKKATNVLIAFGAPSQGLYEIVKQEGLDLDRVTDFVINTFPVQGTETVRTEEALIVSLAVLNTCLRI